MVTFVLGVILSIVAVLAVWLALGHGTAMWRAILAIVGVSGVALAFCAASGELEAEWLGLVWVVVVALTAMFLCVRWLGFKLAYTNARSRIRSDEFQFSLSQLLALTAVVAVVAAAARLLAPFVLTVNALSFGLAIAICLGIVALVAVGATLRPVITRIKISALVITAIVMAGLAYYGIEATNADPGIVWASTVIVYAIALTGLLLLGRSYGLRLLRSSECSQERHAARQNVGMHPSAASDVARMDSPMSQPGDVTR